MTEAEAQAWLATHGWWEGVAGDRLRAFAELVVEENARQNLIAASTVPHLWDRHIVDSAQLLALADAQGQSVADGLWLDLGSGGGFPGIVIACLREAPVLLVESRKLRIEFLQRCIDTLGLSHACVFGGRVEALRLEAPAACISARAFAPLPRTLELAAGFSTAKTLWLLPKGRNAEMELASVGAQWQAVFHVEQSVTDADSAILVATGVQPRRSDHAARQQGRRRR